MGKNLVNIVEPLKDRTLEKTVKITKKELGAGKEGRDDVTN